MPFLKIAHISDLHFSKICKGLSQFFSKAWLGNLNLLFNRKYDYSPEGPYALISLFKEKGITDVIISGDLTTTSSKEEFALAEMFVNRLREEGLKPHLIPGNHDHYTKSAYRKKIFYHYFESEHLKEFPYNLVEHGVSAKRLNPDWWLVLMDTTLATPLTSSNGYFTKKTEMFLEKLLKGIPSNENILIVNHFPFFQNEKPKKRLLRGDSLRKSIEKHPNIQLYLHGHTHKQSIADCREKGLPIILDSGSTAYQEGSCHLLQLGSTTCDLAVFRWKEGQWSQTEKRLFKDLSR